jgi:cytochrome c oxidase subunit 1
MPYASSTGGAVTWMTFGVFVIGFSSILTGINFITTIHKLRAPGITWDKLPLFCWGLYAVSIIQILATPVLAITLALVGMERILGIGIFDPALGGDPVLYQHFFWFYSHPAVYIMIVPGFGIVSEIVTTFSKKTIFGYWAIALSSLAIAFISFLVWGHHMFVSGQASLANMVFSFLSFLVGIPTGIKMFNWLATMHRGSISLKTPMLYILGFFFLFTVGGLTGIALATLAIDVHLHDTYYVVAHFHFVMVGGMVMAYVAGLYYWWPKISGRMYNEMLGKISCLLIFLGFNITFLPQFVMGAQGMPRRYFNYIDQFQPFHQISTVGSFILGLGFMMVFYNLVKSLYTGPKAPPNPWNSRALEWQVASPAPPHNFDHIPVVIHGPYDYHKPMADFQLGLAQTNGHDPTHGDHVEIDEDLEMKD